MFRPRIYIYIYIYIYILHIYIYNIYIYIYILYIYRYIYVYVYVYIYTQYSMVIGRNGGLGTLCHSCRFAPQQRVLKTFPGPGYLRFEKGIV